MSDDPFYTPGRVSPPPRVPRLGEPLWELRRDYVAWSCELRFHGESYGWEVQILRDGKLVIGQRFVLRQMAEAWAEESGRFLRRARRDGEDEETGHVG